MFFFFRLEANTRRLYKLTDEHASELDRANLSANIVSTLQAGCFAGALLAAYAADRLGRRPVLIWGAGFISIVGVIFQAAASGHLEPMYIGRYESSAFSLTPNHLPRSNC